MENKEIRKNAVIEVYDVDEVDYDALIEYLHDHHIEHSIENEETEVYDNAPDPYDRYVDWCLENDQPIH